MSLTRHLATPALAGLLAIGLAVPAFAETADTADSTAARSVTVNFGDLDLATTKGRARLEHRIQIAAAQVCGELQGMRPLPQEMEARRCYDETMVRARTSLASAMEQRHLAVR